ncbi:EAL domain-containing protein [Catenovulum agarivorans]|uniref:EAL domain-containing response regulator n=1 Tax=Catenovulum agarivorans TaxID=1172192 RepID=UPI0002EF39E7|nr:EAL domain-containing protein [Catenovulum agarivorans]
MNSRTKVLLVEDDSVTRELVSHTLKVTGGYQVYAFSNFADAYKAILSIRYDIALLDIGLPDGTGTDLLKKIRENETPISLPIVMLSGDRTNKRVIECFKLGANEYITKPIDLDILLARVSNLLIIRHLDEDITRANERFSLAANGANDGLWDWFIHTGEIYFSQRWKKMLGYEESQFPNEFKAFIERIHPDDLNEFNRALRSHLEGLAGHFVKECRVKHKEGNYRWMMIRGAAIRYENGKAYRMAGSMTDINNRKMMDPLTGLLNRSAFLDQLELLINSKRAKQIHSYAILLISIDRYKLISDSYGHHIGDRIIQEVANYLSKVTPSAEFLARVESSKFAMSYQNPPNLDQIQEFATQELAAPLKIPLIINDKELHITMSVAIVFDTEGYLNSQDILRDADIALQNVWAMGNQQVVTFQSTLQISLKDKVELEEDLHTAIDQRQFETYLQPKSDRAGKIIGAEALVRWNHPRRGLVSPMEFIPLAEETGLINAIGYQVIQDVCRLLGKWTQDKIVIPIAVNLSARQFINPSLPQDIFELLNNYNLPTNLFELEITESLLLENLEQALPILAEFSQKNMAISVDDFGTGYSSLGYLKSLPITTLKVDKSFVENLPDDKDDKAIVEAIVHIANALNLKIVAEGVESIAQVSLLSALGVEIFQGYYFAKPMPVSAFEQKLLEQFAKDAV